MNKRKIILAGIFSAIFLIGADFAYGRMHAEEPRKLIIFHSPTCRKCIEVKNELMPDIEKEFYGRIDIEYRDISALENYKLLLSLREKYKSDIAITLPVFFIKGKFLNGKGEIRNSLKALITSSLISPPRKEKVAVIDLISHFRTFTPVAVLGAGLIDGINPCAFTVIVFFISFLALQGYRKRELIIIGLSFISSVFFTYLLMGIGIFNFLYQLKGFWLATKITSISVGTFSIVLGGLAIYDFFKFKRTHSTEGLFLQLPQSVKNQIHYVVGLHYRKTKTPTEKQPSERRHIFRLFITALFTGFLVSLLEAVCTGQVYLPTITFILKTSPLKLQALSYLLLYNFMFIVPLLIIFLFALLGATSEEFSRFLKKHLLVIKILMAIVFFGLGVFLLWSA